MEAFKNVQAQRFYNVLIFCEYDKINYILKNTKYKCVNL